MLGYEFQLGLRAVEESLSAESARTDGNLALVNVVACSCQVFLEAEQHVDTHALVGLHDIVEHIVGGVEEGDAAQCESSNEEVVAQARAQSLIDEYADENCR